MLQAKAFQRLLGNLPSGNSSTNNAPMPLYAMNQTQDRTHAVASPAGRERGRASNAYVAYWPQKWSTPPRKPTAKKSHPMGCPGRREAIKAPISEALVATTVTSTQYSKVGTSGCDRCSAKSKRLKAVNVKENPQTDQDIRAAVRMVILPTRPMARCMSQPSRHNFIERPPPTRYGARYDERSV
jgi:hypothetical protein